MISTTRCDNRKERVDGVTQARKRELQVVQAVGQQCKRTAEELCREMAEKRSELDLATDEYKHRKGKLVELETKLHDRLASMLRSRSAAELSVEKVRDYAENELKAQRTASTVRAYRLDERWCQLHDRYRGFAIDVLEGDRPSAERTQPARKTGRRRFFAAADKFSAQYRRESLRTSRSLHTLMAGYLRETATAPSAGGCTVPGGGGKSHSYRQALATLDRAEPEQVLVKLRVMQEQCAWIAERVRRRTESSLCAAADGGDRNAAAADDGVDIKRLQVDLLSEAHRRLATGRDYLHRIRQLMDRAILDVERDQTELRKLLFETCSVCIGRKMQMDTVSYTMVEVAGLLERSCFALFSRLDRTVDDSQQRNRSCADGAPVQTATHDVVTLCLRAVQTHRMNTVRQACDTARRVDNFCKAVTRLLLATTVLTPKKLTDNDRHRSPTNISKGRVIRNESNKMSLGREVTSSRVLRTPRKVHDKLSSTPLESQQKKYTCAESSPQISTDIVAITMLCPPSIDRCLNTYE